LEKLVFEGRSIYRATSKELEFMRMRQQVFRFLNEKARNAALIVTLPSKLLLCGKQGKPVL